MLLGARQSLWRGGRLSARSYVQEGLIAQWDGIENVAYGEHDPNAKVWKDLTGECDIPLNDYQICPDRIESPVDKGSFLTSSINLVGLESVNAPRSLEIVMFPGNDSNWSGVDVGNHVGFKVHYFSVNNWWTAVCANRSDLNWNNGPRWIGGGDKFSASISYPVNSKMLVKFNDLVENEVSSGIGSEIIPAPVRIRSTIANNGIPLRMYSVRLYNRTLTPEEIAHNYAIDKERFGL